MSTGARRRRPPNNDEDDKGYDDDRQHPNDNVAAANDAREHTNSGVYLTLP